MKNLLSSFYEVKNLEYYYVDLKNDDLSNVVNKTLYYYVKNSILYKLLFYTLSFFSITMNASIPIINQIDWENSTMVVTIISACTAVITGMLALLCLKESWYRYRTAAEKLKTECNQFNAEIGDYRQIDTKIESFIINFEKINSDEKGRWSFEKESNEINTDIIKDKGNELDK